MRYLLLGTVLVVLGSGVAATQTDTIRSPASAVPDSIVPPPEGSSSEAIRRAVICSSVSNHEPTDSLTTVPSNVGKVFFFTELVGLEGKTITHRWLKDGAKVADVRISVASNRYRCHSSRSVAGKAGNWSVQVLDGDGDRLVERTFTVAQTPIGKT